MSSENLPYSPLYIKAWTLFSVTLGVGLLGMFFLGNHLLHVGHIVWAFLRYLASPII